MQGTLSFLNLVSFSFFKIKQKEEKNTVWKIINATGSISFLLLVDAEIIFVVHSVNS
jgi:hypothetical protein